jgi:ribosomal protein S12 methylthiotransferase accessory factor
MLQESDKNSEEMQSPEWRLGHLEPFFDVLPMPSGPLMHICAAVPNARALERWPDFPVAALPASGRVATGCGLTAMASRRSGIGEAVELMKSCVWGDEQLVTSSASALGTCAIRPDRINGFSRNQMRFRARTNQMLGGHDWVPAAFCADAPLDWIDAEEAGTGRRVYVPADAVLIGLRNPGDAGAVAVADSNGCACGPTAELAKLAGLLELIERDAVARWWFGKRRRPPLALSVLETEPELRAYLTTRPRICRLFDITTDLAVPVVVAASFEPDGTVLALGFAAKVDLAAAAFAATVEMLAVETSLPPWRDISGDPLTEAWVEHNRACDPPIFEGWGLADAVPTHVDEAPAQLDACIHSLLTHHCQVVFIDLSRGDVCAPVFKVMSPELCHIKPRFGKARLLAQDGRDLEQTKGVFYEAGAKPILQ